MPRLDDSKLGHVDKWLRSVLWDNKLPGSNDEIDFEIHRSKGRIVFDDGTAKMLQGVREVFELSDAPRAGEVQPEQGKIILIGRNLSEAAFVQSFEQSIH